MDAMRMKVGLVISVFVALVFWTLMFCPVVSLGLPFWHLMATAACVLTVLSIWLGRDLWRDKCSVASCDVRYILGQIVLGVGLAVLLWCVFWLGDKLSQWLFPSFARAQVNDIYSIKDGADARWIGLLLLLLIGPSEELFWRGYVQERLQRLCSHPLLGALVGIVLYTAIHVPSCNFMLIVAAGVCGVVWGGLYWWKPQWFPALVLSHALWDAAVFVWFPI